MDRADQIIERLMNEKAEKDKGMKRPLSAPTSPKRDKRPSRPTSPAASQPTSPVRTVETTADRPDQPSVSVIQVPNEKVKPPPKKKKHFTRELRQMMYGFGDVVNPLPQSVDLMEEIALEYITEITQQAMNVATKKGKLQTEDMLFVIRKDRKKYARVLGLLSMNEELKKARRAFEIESCIKSGAV